MGYDRNKTLPKGTQLGVYEIKLVLKISEFDITYRAWNHHLKEWVKIQEYFPQEYAVRAHDGVAVLPRSSSNKNIFEYGRKIFVDQSEILAQIRHPNIVAAENILQLNGTAYLILSEQEGIPLSKLIQSVSLTNTELEFVLMEILNALHIMHGFKIVHGSIRPDAIFLSKEGAPKLTNFSAARMAFAANTQKLSREFITGYAPIEQYEFANKLGPASDFYALGATVYYLITQHQPAEARNRIKALKRGEIDPMIPFSESVITTHGAKLIEAINWMLQPLYNNRPQSTTEILALLQSEPINNQAKPLATKQIAISKEKSNPIHKNKHWIGGMIGIFLLVIIGLWIDDEPSNIIDNKANTETNRSLFRHNIIMTTNTHELVENPSTILVSAQLNQMAQGKMLEPQDDKNLIQRNLAAAEEAIKVSRLTSPSEDNAYKHYMEVLAMEPDNAGALSGVQKIFDIYVQQAEKASAEGKLNMAILYLQRAESILLAKPRLYEGIAGNRQ